METELLFGRDEGSVPTGQSLYFARTEALIEKYHVEHKYLIYCFYICRQIGSPKLSCFGRLKGNRV